MLKKFSFLSLLSINMVSLYVCNDFDCAIQRYCPLSVRTGLVLQHNVSLTLDECQSLCNASPNCTSFSFASIYNGSCLLLSRGCNFSQLSVVETQEQNPIIRYCSKRCPMPTCSDCNVEFGSQLDDIFALSYIVANFSCFPGKVLVGPASLTCNSTSMTWGSIVPACTALSNVSSVTGSNSSSNNQSNAQSLTNRPITTLGKINTPTTVAGAAAATTVTTVAGVQQTTTTSGSAKQLPWLLVVLVLEMWLF